MTRRTLLIAWDVAVLAALAAYVSQFAALDAQSSLFPRLIGYPVAALTVVSLGIQTIGSFARFRDADGASDRMHVARLALGILFTVAYIALWQPLGFQIDTVVFLMVAPALLGFRRPFVLLAIALGLAILVVFLFHLGSGAILPRGLLRVEWP